MHYSDVLSLRLRKKNIFVSANGLANVKSQQGRMNA